MTMKTKSPADKLSAAKSDAAEASNKSETARKIAKMAKARFKAAKSTYKLAKKAAKRAARYEDEILKRLKKLLAKTPASAKSPAKGRAANKAATKRPQVISTKSAARRKSNPKRVSAIPRSPSAIAPPTPAPSIEPAMPPNNPAN